MGETRRRTLAVGLAFVLAIAGTFAFAYRAGRRARHIRTENEPIHGWMSVPFIAHSHHVPTSVLFQAIGVQPQQPHDRRSVRHIARDVNRPVPELIGQLQRAIDAAGQPPGVQPPGVQPRGVQPPGVQPRGVQPPGGQPRGVQPPGGQPR